MLKVLYWVCFLAGAGLCLWQFVIPGEAILIGVAVSAAVGLLFGLSPARRASQKDPIEALRYE